MCYAKFRPVQQDAVSPRLLSGELAFSGSDVILVRDQRKYRYVGYVRESWNWIAIESDEICYIVHCMDCRLA